MLDLVVRLEITGLRRVNETCATRTVNKNISIIAVALCTFLQFGGWACGPEITCSFN